MSTHMSVGDPPMSFNFTASNSTPGDINNGGYPWKYYTTDGTWIQNDQDFTVQPQSIPNINIPWIIQDVVGTPMAPVVGTLRINPVSGMIEMWDGAVWQEYGKPINPLPEQPKAEDEGFELGGAL